MPWKHITAPPASVIASVAMPQVASAVRWVATRTWSVVGTNAALAVAGLDGAEIVPIDSLTAQKRMVEAGFGLALLPESALDEGALRVLDVAALRAAQPVVLVRRPGAFESGAVRALRSLLVAGPANVDGGR